MLLKMNSGGRTQMGIIFQKEPCWMSRSQLKSFNFYDFMINAYFSLYLFFFKQGFLAAYECGPQHLITSFIHICTLKLFKM